MLKLRNRSTRVLVLVLVLGASMMIIMMGTHQLVVAVPSSTTRNHNRRLEWLDSSRLKRHRGRGQRAQRRQRGRQLWWNHRQQDSGKSTTTTVTTVTTTATRKPTPSPTTTAPTAAPSPTPTTASPTVEPSTTSGGPFEEGIAKNPWRRMLLRWSLFIPVISFSIMAWAVRKSTRRCVCCADWLIDDAVPEEIVVTRKKPRSPRDDDDVIDNEDDGSDHSALGQRDADVELVPVQTIRSYPEHWTDPGVDPLLRNVPFDESRYHNSGSSTSLDDGILLKHEYRRMN